MYAISHMLLCTWNLDIPLAWHEVLGTCNRRLKLLICLKGPLSLWRSLGGLVTHDCSHTPRHRRHYSRTLIWRHSVRKAVGPCRKTRHTILPYRKSWLDHVTVAVPGRKAVRGVWWVAARQGAGVLAGESRPPHHHHPTLWWFRAYGYGSGRCRWGERKRSL